MSWLEFIAKIISALAWPTAFLVALFMLRKHIISLIPGLRRLKYKDIELEFSESLKELTRKVPTEVLPEAIPQETNETFDHLSRLATISPRAAILESWIIVEAAAAEAIEKLKIAPYRSGPIPAIKLGEYLKRAEVLNDHSREVFDSLRYLRNQAVHSSEAEFAPKDVGQYIDLAITLAQKIQSYSKNS
jgi:hypothetical protein